MRLSEGEAVIEVPDSGQVSRRMPVFYNPVMKHNRDISIHILSCIPDINMSVCLPLAASGIRGIRMLKELDEEKIESVVMGDLKSSAVMQMKTNLALNNITSKCEVFCSDANTFLRSQKPFDYIDIDPFGTPNPFLDSAIRRLKRNAILAVTATDTASLCGQSQKSCMRKYWAVPLHNHMMHEAGIRILIRKVQLVAAQYALALVPIYSYSKDHYMRVFFRCSYGKGAADALLASQGFYDSFGPMWLGTLWDNDLACLIAKKAYLLDHSLAVIVRHIAAEASIGVVGFYDLHDFCKKRNLRLPKTAVLLSELAKSHPCSQTHFREHSIRSAATEEELESLIRNL
ncbi:MAG: hypothetical protein ABIF10_03505 [Candidatus Woesearchaeota archaeon]